MRMAVGIGIGSRTADSRRRMWQLTANCAFDQIFATVVARDALAAVCDLLAQRSALSYVRRPFVRSSVQ